MTARKRSKKAAGGALATRMQGGAVALPASVADEFGDFVSREKASTTQTGGLPWISTQGSTAIMRANLGGDMAPVGDESGALDCIILGGNRSNLYYEGAFEPGAFRPPKCYAVADVAWQRGEVEDKLAPPADLAGKEAPRCKECRWNAFGTADRGRGKACKNTVRLMLLPSNASDYEKADGYMLSLPPTSLGSWSKYVSRVVDGLRRPVATVVTRIRKVPNEKGAGFTLAFEPLSMVQDEEALRAIAGRVRGDAPPALMQPPPSEAPDAPGGKAPQRRRKVERRTRAQRRAAR